MTSVRTAPPIVRIGVLLAAAVSLLSVSACGDTGSSRLVELSGPTMGTTWSVKLVPSPRGLARAEVQAIDGHVRDLLVRIEGLMSTWDPTSELSRFNAYRGDEPFPVSPDTFAVFRAAVAFSDETGGALDVTVLPLVHAWGFGARGNDATHAPDDETLARLRASTGVRHLALDPEGRWVRKLRPDVECDFSSLAPGYAADRLAELLRARGLAGFLLDVGGELVAWGRNAEGAVWRLGVDRPEARRRAAAVIVPLDHLAIATSGDYRAYREIDGTRVSHIIDPRTARPVRHALTSATVIERSAMRADALATALMVLGPDEGMALARRLDLTAFLLVRNSDGGVREHATPRFEDLMRTR